MKKPLCIISLALAACCIWITPGLTASPTEYVRGIMTKVMGIQNDAALSTQARARAIHQIIEQSFDFPMMAKDSLGETYGRISSGQQQQFIRTFSYLFQDSYTRMVLNFLKQENIKYGQERLEGDRARLDTTIVRTNENIPVTYLMHQVAQGWILYDVIVDGVSILHNYKTQFAKVIKSQSFDVLFNKLEEQRRAIQ